MVFRVLIVPVSSTSPSARWKGSPQKGFGNPDLSHNRAITARPRKSWLQELLNFSFSVQAMKHQMKGTWWKTPAPLPPVFSKIRHNKSFESLKAENSGNRIRTTTQEG
ncbi:hypothetical protein Zmor_011226 [Zophobas morio]|uniref:Uncharacterized protein n=1 Tax=Zophobas morio TaxID=2755281 RepID=A0AA38MKR9_9CUCU|nr:hypothetical protein Zmor_011226 [Zophobas morio]